LSIVEVSELTVVRGLSHQVCYDCFSVKWTKWGRWKYRGKKMRRKKVNGKKLTPSPK